MNIEDLYILFRRQQSLFLGRPYRIPKDVKVYIETKFSTKNKENLKQLSLWFATKWQNIDPEKYIKYGFELFGKGFTYTKFFDDKLLNYYISKDKAEKYNQKHTKKELTDSIKFVVDYMKDKEKNNSFCFFQNYCKQKDGEKKVIIEHYLKNKISALFFVYMLFKRYIILSEDEELLVPLVISNQRELKYKILNLLDFLKKIEDVLNGRL